MKYKKILNIFFLLIVLVFTLGASNSSNPRLSLHYDKAITIHLDDQVVLKTNSLYTYSSSDESILSYDKDTNLLTAVGKGSATVNKIRISDNKVVRKYVYSVSDEATSIVIIGVGSLVVGENTSLQASVLPSSANQEVTWQSSDDNVLTVDDNGKVTAISVGLAKVVVRSKSNDSVYSEQYIMVKDAIEATIVDVASSLDQTDIAKAYNAIYKKAKDSILFVSSYTISNSKKILYDSGCGIIYKRVTHLLDETTTTDFVSDLDTISHYEYYVVTNKHIVSKTTYNMLFGISTTTDIDYVSLYYGNSDEIKADIVAYDSKIDLAVLKFTSAVFFPTAEFGESESIKSGEFIVTIGSGVGKEYFQTLSSGIISYPKRYISLDTDGDGTNDWDAEYIQHDAAINECDCGSPLVNMKGEVIGINTDKKLETSSGIKVENLSFAIPIKLVETLVAKLEQGIVPERPLLGVTILSVIDILKNEEYYAAIGTIIPENITYGFYVDSVTAGGVAYKAGVKPGDIIVAFNGTRVAYSYELRGQLDYIVKDSGYSTTIVVIRDGKEVTLSVTF